MEQRPRVYFIGYNARFQIKFGMTVLGFGMTVLRFGMTVFGFGMAGSIVIPVKEW